jgi:predicted enzyme related to lactoylglutathione lyase
MPTRDSAWPAGTPCWVDYAATDLDAAKSLYADILGWDYTEGNEEFGGYLTCLRKDRGAAGMMPKMEADQPSAWVTYFATDDSEKTAELITTHGGTILGGPHPVGTLGTMLIALDPQGAVFGSWQAADHKGVGIYNEPGALVWNEAAMPDPEAAKAFYADVFGFSFEAIPESEGYSTFSTGGGPLGGIGGHEQGSPQGWMTCFSVESTDAAADTIAKAGGTVHTAPQDTPFGRFAVLADPWGATFEVMQPAPEAP